VTLNLLCHVNIEKDRESFVLKTVKTTEGAELPMPKTETGINHGDHAWRD